jgi:hypothetical protein
MVRDGSLPDGWYLVSFRADSIGLSWSELADHLRRALEVEG